MVAYFKKANLYFRRQRPIAPECTICTSFIQGDLLEMAFPSTGCRYDAAGTCIMCDYGKGILPEDYESVLHRYKEILAQNKGSYKYLLLCTNGSFLDERNIPMDLQKSILDTAVKSEADEIIIETHVNTLDIDKLHMLKQLLPGKRIAIELGIESINSEIRESCFIKPMDDHRIKEIVSMTAQMQIALNINTMLGAPFLSLGAQLQDTLDTVLWALKNGLHAIVFPMVIKPYTTLRYMHSKGLYDPVSYWLVVVLLHLCQSEALERIQISWIGPTTVEYVGEEDKPVLPTSCACCRERLYTFFDEYTKADTYSGRKQLLDMIWEYGKIEPCMIELQQKLKQETDKGRQGLSIQENQKIVLDVLRQDAII